MEARAVSTPAASGLAPGSRLGRYQIIRSFAKGGMAELYLARQTGAAGYQKIVALKRVLPHLANEDTFLRMFLNEAKLAAGLDHSNIVHVLDFGSEGEEHFMVMEYVHGRSVLHILRESARKGGLPIAAALTIVSEVAAALHYAHERVGTNGRPLGLVHRDVSPSNVLVSFDGDVKLVDFGIAKATAHQTLATRSSAIKGKLAYMAPEQARGQDLDRRADIFALSAVTYELCTGRRCFVAPGEFALLNRVAAARYDRPSSFDPAFPRDLEAIIMKGLSRTPTGRFGSARELQIAIEEFAATQGHRLSRVGLSELMRELFGEEEYPRTDILLPPFDAVDRRVERTTRGVLGGPRIWALVCGALVAGLLVGVTVQSGSDLPQSNDSVHVSGDLPAAAPSATAAASSPAVGADASTPSPSVPAEPTDAAAAELAPAAEAPADRLAPVDDMPKDDRPERASARGKTHRKSRTPKKKNDGAAASDYLPPTQRRG